MQKPYQKLGNTYKNGWGLSIPYISYYPSVFTDILSELIIKNRRNE